jgi:hypothetical protein
LAAMKLGKWRLGTRSPSHSLLLAGVHPRLHSNSSYKLLRWRQALATRLCRCCAAWPN